MLLRVEGDGVFLSRVRSLLQLSGAVQIRQGTMSEGPMMSGSLGKLRILHALHLVQSLWVLSCLPFRRLSGPIAGPPAQQRATERDQRAWPIDRQRCTACTLQCHRRQLCVWLPISKEFWRGCCQRISRWWSGKQERASRTQIQPIILPGGRHHCTLCARCTTSAPSCYIQTQYALQSCDLAARAKTIQKNNWYASAGTLLGSLRHQRGL